MAEAEVGVQAVELAADTALEERAEGADLEEGRAIGEVGDGLFLGDKAEGHPLALEPGHPGGRAMTRPVAGSLAPE